MYLKPIKNDSGNQQNNTCILIYLNTETSIKEYGPILNMLCAGPSIK